VKIENLRKKVETEQAKRKSDDAEETEFEIVGVTQDGDPIVDETPEEDEVTLESLKLDVDSFTSADAIKSEAKELDGIANEAGLNAEERSELRNYINNKFRELNK
jgi:hypothetical protein